MDTQELEGELALIVDQISSLLGAARQEEREFEEGLTVARKRRQRLEKTYENLTGEAAPGKEQKKSTAKPNVSNRLLNKVRTFMRDSTEPVTVTQIAVATGLHDSSTRNALTILRENEEVRKAGINEHNATLYALMPTSNNGDGNGGAD